MPRRCVNDSLTSLRLLTDPAAHAAMARAANPYGDGRASERIVEAVVGQDGPLWNNCSR